MENPPFLGFPFFPNAQALGFPSLAMKFGYVWFMPVAYAQWLCASYFKMHFHISGRAPSTPSHPLPRTFAQPFGVRSFR